MVEVESVVGCGVHAGRSLATGVGHSAGEQQRVDGGLPDDQQERTVGQEDLTVQVQGASDGDHGRGGRRLAAFLIHLQTQKHNSQDPDPEPEPGT